MRTGTIGRLTATAVTLLALAACGGGNDALTQPPPAEPTPLTVIGKITGFGSVYVNGIEFETDGASFDVDDTFAQSDDALAVGMIIKVSGSVNPDGRTGSALTIRYDDEVEGRIENLAADPADSERLAFSVMGIAVIAANTTRFEGEDDPNFGFDTISNGDNVEISGVFDGDVLMASFIEKQDAGDNDFEVNGIVSAFNGTNRFDLVLHNDDVWQITVAAGAAIPAAGIVDGQFVEVEGTIPDPVNAPTALLASKVELEDNDDLSDEDVEVELLGVLNLDAETGAWFVGGVALAFADNTEFKPESLADGIEDGTAAGLTVEVEGTHADGVLLVEEIEVEEANLDFEAIVAAIALDNARNGTITLSFGGATGTVDVVIDNHTLFVEDDSTAPFDLTDIAAGDHLDIDARMAVDGAIRATSLQRDDGPGIEVTGPVDAFDGVSITILGITFTVDASTRSPDGTPVAGQFVEVEDGNADGLADTIEIED